MTRLSLADAALGGASLVTMLAALVAALVLAPTERVQGDVQRIFYLHVPLAWVAYLAFFIVFAASIAYLRTRSAWWDALALGARPAETWPWLQLLAGFDVILLGLSYALFEYVLEE